MVNNPELLKMPLARDGQKSAIPETTDASTGLFSQQYGWQSINSLPPQAGGKAVKREDFNGAFNLLGGIAFMAQKGFTFKWSAEQDYYAGCVVTDPTDGQKYECIADVSAGGSAPSADSTHWRIFKAGTDIDAWFRQASTVYAVGDLRCYESLPYGWYLECTTAGTTGSGDITLPTPLVENTTITDGTVVWKVEEIGSMITAIESDGGLVTLTRVDGSTEQLQIVANNAGAHNAVYRGKDLTAYFDSGEMSKAIAAGTFKDIYPGDYITKSVTVNGTTYSDVKWMVGDLDYFLGQGDTSILTQHHVLMFPDTCLGNSYMNPTNTTEGAYMGSYMYKTMIPLVNAGIQAAFGASHVVSHREYMSKLINATMACASGNGWTGSTYWAGGEWADVLSNLFTENMVYGANIFSSSPQDVCNGCRQVAAFRHDSSLYIGGTKRETWWLRAVAFSDAFAYVDGCGVADCTNASYVLGVRPYFLLA